ncbi:T9SS type A sorting domain-containing protein [Luteirhabdus pelagi]|uniref:T9SS type A sorting domain-containing protein n=1 Tax=Luteirhabdus pelagi TaxID=2792783 RepID=UPI00193A021A|nr:T9SS type A sorting domain-containing protein [Luteirhabdus pelagi]
MVRSFLLLTSLLISSLGIAQTHTWTGNGGDTDWNNADNWDVLTVPNASSDILISGAVEVDISAANNGATIVIEQGARLVIDNSLTITEEVTVTNAEIEISGTLYNNGGTIVIEPNAQLEVGGTLENTNILEVAEGAAISFQSGIIEGGGTIENFGTIVIEGSDGKEISNTILNNHNEIQITDSGVIDLSSGMVLNNEEDATIQVASTGGLTQVSSHDATVNNYGTIWKQNLGVSNSFYMIFDMNNHGTIHVEENQTLLFLTIGADFNNHSDGVLIGDGTFDITANFTNTGTIIPGGMDAIGSLDFVNNFHFPSDATIAIDVDGINNYDSIDIIGFPVLAGSFSVNMLSELSLDDELTILTANDIDCNLPNQVEAAYGPFDVYIFDVFCNATSVVLKVSTILLADEEFETLSYDFSVSPNPASETITFHYSEELLQNPGEASVAIYTIMGQKISSLPIKTETTPYTISDLNSGCYFASLRIGDSSVKTIRVLVE